MKKVIFWGATGHARVLKELMDRLDIELVALFDNNESLTRPFDDIPLYFGERGFIEWRHANPEIGFACLVAIGGARGKDRVEIQRFLEGHGIMPVTAIHPAAFVASGVRISKGSQVLAGATVCVDVSMGEACIINTSVSVDHECVLGDGVHIAPGATIAGCVSVGEYSLVGAGAVVLPRIRIGKNSIVGAGSVVTRDVPDGKIAYGNPARIVRDNEILQA